MKKIPSAIFFILPLAFLASGAEESAVYSLPGREIISIQDMPMTMSGALFRSADPAEKVPKDKNFAASLNVFLIRLKDRTGVALIDAGYGKAGSMLMQRLKEQNVKPEDVEAVFITHIHPDHVGGLTSADGKMLFPNAKIFLARQEYREWSRDADRAGLARHLTPYGDRITLLDFEEEIKPWCLTPLSYPGHTPGHTVYKMKIPSAQGDEEETICFVGDIVHAVDLQVPHSRICARFDGNPAAAAASRLDLLTREKVWFGAHIPFPGRIRIERKVDPRNGRAVFGFSKE